MLKGGWTCLSTTLLANLVLWIVLLLGSSVLVDVRQKYLILVSVWGDDL